MERVVERVDALIPAQPKALRVCAYARVSTGKDPGRLVRILIEDDSRFGSGQAFTSPIQPGIGALLQCNFQHGSSPVRTGFHRRQSARPEPHLPEDSSLGEQNRNSARE